MHVLAWEVVNSSKAATASGGDDDTKADINVMTTYMLATLMGWMHLTKEEKDEPIWPHLMNAYVVYVAA